MNARLVKKKELATAKAKTKAKATAAEEKLKANSRDTSIKEGSVYSVSDGFGLRYITPYALALGASNAHIGILNSLPSLLGTFSQLYSIKAMNKISRKKICFYSAVFQAIMWLPIILLGLMFFVFHIDSMTTPTLLVAVYTLLVIGGAFYGPAWNSWMKDLVSAKESGIYFGMRSRICGAAALFSMLVAGFVLDYFKELDIFFGFAILFLVAFIARSISAFLFTKKYEPEFKPEKEYYFDFWQFLKKMRSNNFGRFVIFVSLLNFAVAIASPFFAVYMLKDLQFSYVIYTIIVMTSSFSVLIFVPIWGKFADKYGNIKVLQLCGSVVFIVPIAWLAAPFLLSHHPGLLVPYLILIEFFSGFAWAGFNLSASNFIFDAVTRQRMALCVAYDNILNSLGAFIGAMIGGLISSFSFVFLGLSSLLFLFLLSGIMRIIIYFAMIPRIREVREVKKFGLKEAKDQILGLSPRKIMNILK